MKSSLLVALLILISGFAFTQTIPSVKIGNQIWMTKNLNVSTFRNGDPIPEVKSTEEWFKAGENGQAAWCYYQNDNRIGAIYGILYNVYAVFDPRGLCPNGWQVPSDSAWVALSKHCGGNESAGKELKSTSSWDENDEYSYTTNSTGFSALSGGIRQEDGRFVEFGRECAWWSSTRNEEREKIIVAWMRKGYNYLRISADMRQSDHYGLPVRCIKK